MLAEEHYRLALAERPNYVEAIYGLGQVYEEKAKAIQNQGGPKDERNNYADLAVRHYEETIHLEPGFPTIRPLLIDLLLGYGQILEQEGSPEQAIARYQAALVQIDAFFMQDPEMKDQQSAQELRARIEADLRRLRR